MAIFPNLVESLIRRMEAITAAKEEQLNIDVHGFEKGMFNTQVYSFFQPAFCLLTILLQNAKALCIKSTFSHHIDTFYFFPVRLG